jgi:transposase
MNTATIGLDIAKAVFQVHGIDARGQTTLQKRLRRPQLVAFFGNVPPCLGGYRGLRTRPSLGA